MAQWLGAFCLIASLLILWQVRQMLLLLFAAIVIATALNGLARWLKRRGVSPQLAIPTAIGLTVFVGIIFIALIVPPFIDQVVELIKLVPTAVVQVVQRIENLFDQTPEWVPDITLPNLSSLNQQVPPLAQNLLRNFVQFFSNSLTALVQTLLVIVLSIMLLSNPLAYRQAFLKLFPSFYRRRADEILYRCEIALDNWMAGLIISSSFVAILSFIGLSVLQVRLVLAHALLAGLLNFIPNIGPTLSIVFPITVVLLDAPWKAIPVLILYIIIQNIESYWLTPSIMAQQVSLLPALTLTAQIFFATFFGVLGLLLALPLTVVAKTWIEEAIVKDMLDHWERPPSRYGIGLGDRKSRRKALASHADPSPEPPDENSIDLPQ